MKYSEHRLVKLRVVLTDMPAVSTVQKIAQEVDI